MTAPRPDHVDVLGQRFEVRWIDGSAADDAPRLGDEAGYGQASRLRQWIAVNSSAGPDQLRDTVLHELLHLALYLLGHGAEDAVVDHLTPVLLDVLRANPAVTEFLLADAPREALADPPSAQRWADVRGIARPADG